MKKVQLLFLCGLMLIALQASAQYGMNRNLEVPQATGTMTMDGVDDEPAWANAPTIDMTANWDGAWSGHPSPDVTATAKLLWTNDTLYVFVKIEDFEPFYWGTPGSPYKGEQILIGVDGTHTDDTATNSDWGGWPKNAPDKGATTYKISEGLISLNWGYDGIFPIDSGWTHGTVFVDTVNYIWGVEMAMYMHQIQPNGKIGFNIGGANASRDWYASYDSTDHAYAYYSWLSAGSPGGDVMHVAKSFGTISLTMPTAVGKEQGKLPVTFALSQNYPNPFNPSTTIQYALPRSGNVALVIYNLLGQEVARLLDGPQSAGDHSVTWNARNVSSGMYFYRLTVDDKPIAVRKMMLLK